MNCRVFPPDEMLETQVSLPLSKSISNRALVINALTDGALPLKKVAKCDDTDVMVAALSSDEACVNIGAAGTAMRFLTAYYSSQPGREIVIDGTERMRHRPIAVLVDALRACGATIEYVGEECYPPLRISGKKLHGGDITLSASVSSQYISALLMIAPTMEQGLRLTLEGDIISRPYIMMTLSMMRRWGVESEFVGNTITIAPQKYIPIDFEVEADWSAASYWYEIAALSSGDVSLCGVNSISVQGDSEISKYFEYLGITTHFDDGVVELEPSPDLVPRLNLDLSDQPDLAQTIVVTSCMLGIPFHITGLSTLKIKETDRLEALRAEMLKLGIVLTIERDSELLWDGSRRPIYEIPVIDTYEDHRMAMAFAPVSLFVPGIVINNIEVVSKSYPDYWLHLQEAGFKFQEVVAENG
ncbi:MAG: 3-phosphoshikimate 1-carboxyvinyltransferase [Muribaculaceae bacterium]|nr:3-phosphoshikimate 1-carboxyvinyltransferase [Muribaculaceae bacterium]